MKYVNQVLNKFRLDCDSDFQSNPIFGCYIGPSDKK